MTLLDKYLLTGYINYIEGRISVLHYYATKANVIKHFKDAGASV